MLTRTNAPNRRGLSICSLNPNYDFFLAARLDDDVITSDANFMCSDPDGFAFGLISSTMYLTWQKTVGGRIKSDPRFNKLVVWNTFPLPTVSDDTRSKIASAGDAIAEARAKHHSGVPLADMYDTNTASDALLEAHRHLDNIVDAVFKLPLDSTRLERLRLLLRAYRTITS